MAQEQVKKLLLVDGMAYLPKTKYLSLESGKSGSPSTSEAPYRRNAKRFFFVPIKSFGLAWGPCTRVYEKS